MVLKIPDQIRETRPNRPNGSRLILPAPYASWQHELIHGNFKLGVFALGSKAGKTMGGSVRIAGRSYSAIAAQDALFRIVAPYFRQARITYKYLDRLVPEKCPADTGSLNSLELRRAQDDWERFTLERTKSELRMRWPHNKAAIECMHGQQSDAIEGERVHGQLIDEAAKLKEEVYAAAITTTTQTGGWTLLTSTPKGKNWFYRVYREAKEHEEWSLKKGIPPTQIARTIPTWTSPFIDKIILENARKTMPKRIFDQVYGAEFVDEGSVFTELDFAFGYGCGEFETADKFFPEEHQSEQIFIGVDWAKTQDYTVFTALNDKGHLIAFQRLNKLGYPQQVGLLFAFCDRLKATAKKGDSLFDKVELLVKHDQTGVGEAINDIIAATNLKGYAIEGHKWSNSNKEIYVSDLILSLEQHDLRFPAWEKLHHELQVFEVETSPSGNPIFGAPEGDTDDVVMSLVLANNLFRANRRDTGGIIVVDSLIREVEYIHYNMPDLEDFD